MSELADIANISNDRVHILHEYLHMKKLSTRWVSRLLIVKNANKGGISKECLDMFMR